MKMAQIRFLGEGGKNMVRVNLVATVLKEKSERIGSRIGWVSMKGIYKL